MTTRDLERIRFITQHFNDLQGLRSGVPLGLILLALAAPVPLRIALCLAACLLLLIARLYYRSTFGQVEFQPVDPVAELCPVSIFSPAGELSRLEGFQQVAPFTRRLLSLLALLLVLFSFFQALPPNYLVESSAGEGPRVVPESAPYLGPPLIKVLERGQVARAPSMLRAVIAQTMYVLCGAFLLAFWLWRERRASQSLHLALALGLLGLAALGTSLGYLVRPGVPAAFDPLLPALVDPGLASLLCGSAMILAGLFDHWQLVRALGRPAAA